MPDGIQPPRDTTAPELAAETADGALIRRVRRNLVLWSGGTTLLKAPKAKDEWGCFSVPQMVNFDLITLHGKATTSWIDGLVETAKGARDKEFLEKYDVSADLPDWLK